MHPKALKEKLIVHSTLSKKVWENLKDDITTPKKPTSCPANFPKAATTFQTRSKPFKLKKFELK